jgi:NADPH2:quinone reductase
MSKEASMKAIVITKPGAPEVLKLQEVETPKPGKGEIRIKVHACGMNRADILQRLGKYAAPIEAPANIPGLEFAGIVDELGESVSSPALGTPVCGLIGGGAYAEYLTISSKLISPIPKNMSFIQAAAIPEAYLTAFDAMITLGRLTKGETVLIHAVGSGVGIAALQIAKAMGIRTIGTSRNAQKLAKALCLGLDHGLHLQNDHFSTQIMQLTKEIGVDMIIELVGGSYIKEDIECLRQRGRLIIVGLLRGSQEEVNWSRIMQKRLEIHGTVMRSRPPEEKATLARLFESQLTPLFENGALKPVIDKIFPLGEAGSAQEYLSSNESFGKIVLNIST